MGSRMYKPRGLRSDENYNRKARLQARNSAACTKEKVEWTSDTQVDLAASTNVVVSHRKSTVTRSLSPRATYTSKAQTSGDDQLVEGWLVRFAIEQAS